MDESIWSKMTEIFRETFDEDDLTIGPDTTAADVEDWDSVTHVQLMVALEQGFDIKFFTGEIASLENVGEMAALIQRKLESLN